MIRGTGIDSTVKLYLKGNGANGSTKFYDDSQSHHTVTANGNVQISTDHSKFGGSSMYFDSAGDFLSIANNTDFNFLHQVGTDGKWSIGLYFRPELNSSRPITLIDTNAGSSANSGFSMYTYSGSLSVLMTVGISGKYIIQGGAPWTYSAGTWYYIALTYDQSLTSNNLKIFIDGVLHSQATKDHSANTANNLHMWIGQFDATVSEQNMYGYIEDLVICDGVIFDGTKVPTRQRG